MTVLHELLAVEKTTSNQAQRLMQDTLGKFGKEHYFKGHVKSLKMIEDSPQNASLETAASEQVELATTVKETLEYLFKHWAKAEDVIYQINSTNRNAVADLIYEGVVIATEVPVDELMGLEVRLTELRKVMHVMPTLAATSKWLQDEKAEKDGAWISESVETTTKTEKVVTPVVLYHATDKHPAQVEKLSTDKVVGTFSITKFSGAATSAQKAEVLTTIDNLIAAVKQARMRANQVEVSKGRIGQTITDLIMKSFS